MYSETPDILPLLGNVKDDSNIIYIVGCNSLGQASISGTSYLVPALLEERDLEEGEEEMIKFLSIQRFNTRGWKKDPKF